jgi:hypothetical protein
MSKAQSTQTLPEGSILNAGAARESFESMSSAFSDWLQSANRVQTEMIRFISDRFSKDLHLMSRLASCKQPDEFLRLQAEAMSEIASDYMQEGAKLLALFGDASRSGYEEVARAASAARRSAS